MFIFFPYFERLCILSPVFQQSSLVFIIHQRVFLAFPKICMQGHDVCTSQLAKSEDLRCLGGSSLTAFCVWCFSSHVPALHFCFGLRSPRLSEERGRVWVVGWPQVWELLYGKGVAPTSQGYCKIEICKQLSSIQILLGIDRLSILKYYTTEENS